MFLFWILVASTSVLGSSTEADMALIPAGRLIPFFQTEKKPQKSIEVQSFWLDKFPVTNQDFVKFVRSNPEWRKSKVKRIFTDTHYLQNWTTDFQPPSQKSPVAFVSWFAAKAYCEALGKRLPSSDEWEYAAYDEGRNTKERNSKILSWYSHPNPKVLPAIGTDKPNGFGIYDLDGLIWEWVQDFNTPGPAGSEENGAFCALGSQGAADSRDYAAFMRFSFRSSLKANYTIANLGFRCGKDYK